MSLHISLDQQIAELVDRAVRQALTEVLPQAPIQREALSVAEAAEALGMSESWVRTAIREHGLPARRVGGTGHTLIPLVALRTWLAESSVRLHLEVAV